MARLEVTIKVTPTELDVIKKALEVYRGLAVGTKDRNDVLGSGLLAATIGVRAATRAVEPIAEDPRGTASTCATILIGLS